MERDKKKKEKVIYYDDGSTVADMSNFSSKKPKALKEETPRHGFKAKMQTFFGAMRLMLVPLVAMVCALGLMYAIIYLLFSLAK